MSRVDIEERTVRCTPPQRWLKPYFDAAVIVVPTLFRPGFSDLSKWTSIGRSAVGFKTDADEGQKGLAIGKWTCQEDVMDALGVEMDSHWFPRS